MKTILTMRVDLDVEVDVKDPKSLSDAIAWMDKVAAGKIETPDEKLGVVVTARKSPELVRRSGD